MIRSNTETIPAEICESKLWKMFKQTPEGKWEPTGFALVPPAGFLFERTTDAKGMGPQQRTRKGSCGGKSMQGPGRLEEIARTLGVIEAREAAEKVQVVVPTVEAPRVQDAQPSKSVNLRNYTEGNGEKIYWASCASFKDPFEAFVQRDGGRQFLGCFASLAALQKRHPTAIEWKPQYSPVLMKR